MEESKSKNFLIPEGGSVLALSDMQLRDTLIWLDLLLDIGISCLWSRE
jgi:hypothetical protein